MPPLQLTIRECGHGAISAATRTPAGPSDTMPRWRLAAIGLGLSCSVARAAPLTVHPDNPRYFADGGGRAVCLTGSHTWNNLVDMGRGAPSDCFDFDGYLDFLERHGHNFIRLWAWDSSVWHTEANRGEGKDFVHAVAPLPWARTGPGVALDGGLKFDLTRFDPDYFDRLRTRVGAAARRGIYVSVMLFEGWALTHGNRPPAPKGWAWRSHPFHVSNNVNRIDPDAGGITGKVHRLGDRAVNDLQAAYIRRVVDAVNEFDNVLYEVINEGGEREWDWWVIGVVRDHERGKPKQHPIGLTGHGAERLADMLASPADWVSPGAKDGYGDAPPAWDGRKVSLHDTDHIWGIGGSAGWVWRSFLRGHHPIFMDPYDGAVLGTPGDPRWEPVRHAMGCVRRLADRLNLAALRPRTNLASTGYCLAGATAAGAEYLVFVPRGNIATVDVSAVTGDLSVEWLRPDRDETIAGGSVTGGASRAFRCPFDGDAILHLRRSATPSAGPSTVDASSPTALEPPSPRPGDVFREYRWTNAGGDAGGALRVGGRLDYGGGPIVLPHDIDLDSAIRVEIELEKLLCHDGTRGLALSINGHDWIEVPESPGIPLPASDYMHHVRTVIEAPPGQIKPGGGNQVRLSVNPEHPSGWPQNLIYGIHVRVFYDPARKPHPSGRIVSPRPGAALGLSVPLTAEVSRADGRIARVDFVGRYRDVDLAGDGLYTRWHGHLHRGELAHHAGTATSAPWQVAWDTSWLPDQAAPFCLAARVADETGLTFVTDAVGGLTLQRDGLSVELCTPCETPPRWLTRTGEHRQMFVVRGDPARAVAARLVWSSWSPGYMNGLYLNDRLVLEREGPLYACFTHRTPVPDVSALRRGVNVVRTGKTPRYNGTMVHGMEVNWPGIMALIQYRK